MADIGRLGVGGQMLSLQNGLVLGVNLKGFDDARPR